MINPALNKLAEKMTSFFFTGTTAILTTCKENNMLIWWKERCLRGREAVGILTTKKYFRQRVDYFLDNFRN